MATAPTVQTVAQAMADLDPAYASSKSVINSQIGNLGATYTAQKAALDAEKGQGFNDINNQATGRGLSFSGIPLDEQATYLSTKYLPGVQQAQADLNNNTLTLQGRLADLDKEETTNALGTVQKQQSDLNAWNSQQQQQEFEAQQSQLSRDQAIKLEQMQEGAAAAAATTAYNRQLSQNAPPTIDQYLQSAFGDNYNGKNVTNGWTENVLAGNLASAYGLSRQDALNMAYAYRKKYYGN